LTEDLVRHLGYIGFFLVLVLGGLGLPVPEEVPIILAAVLSRQETIWWPFAYGSCLLGVLVGDFVVYFLGYFYGEKVLSLPLTRKFLTKPRETQIKGYFHRHGIKILILGRFAVGFRTAAYLTAGILKLPALKLFLTDLCAATFSTTLMFGVGYIFARQIKMATAEIHRWQHWITLGVALGLGIWLLLRFYKARRRIGQAIGPPVLVDEPPLPPDDLHSGTFATNLAPPLPTSEPVSGAITIVCGNGEPGEARDEGPGVLDRLRETVPSPSGVVDLRKSQVDPIREA
jgi:membrane protein DedA with SNARE-associated domain